MGHRSRFAIVGAAVLGLAATVSHAAVSVIQIRSITDAWWSPNDADVYGEAGAPFDDSFGYPVAANLTAPWTNTRSTSATAPGDSGVTLGTATATASGSYTADISNTLFQFSGQGSATTSLGASPSVPLIEAEGAVSLYVVFTVSGSPVTLSTEGTISIDAGGQGSAKYSVSRLFPGGSEELFSAQAGTWNQTVVLQPGEEYRIDYFATSTASDGITYVHGDGSGSASMNVTTYVPEPTALSVAGIVSGGLLLRRKRCLGAITGGSHA